MLSALYSHTRAWTVGQHQSLGSNSESGDFDSTPASSNRSSSSMPRVDCSQQAPWTAAAAQKDRRRHQRQSTWPDKETCFEETEPLIILDNRIDPRLLPPRRSSAAYKVNASGEAKKQLVKIFSRKDEQRSSVNSRFKIGELIYPSCWSFFNELKVRSRDPWKRLPASCKFPANSLKTPWQDGAASQSKLSPESPIQSSQLPQASPEIPSRDAQSCSVASFSTIGSHPGHHHLANQTQSTSPWQNASDPRHSLSACHTFPLRRSSSASEVDSPISFQNAQSKLSLVDMEYSHSDNINGAMSDISLHHEAALKRSSSVGSLLDYTRASKWLRDMLWYPQSYTTKLTRRPDKADRHQRQQVVKYPSLADIQLAQKVTGLPKHSTRSDSRFDGFLFRRAVSDLERLVNEAVSVASQVMDMPHNYVAASNHSFSNTDEDSSDCSSDASCSSSSQLISADEEIPFTTRPSYKHAQTFSAVDSRPRLEELVEKYSHQGLISAAEEAPPIIRPSYKHAQTFSTVDNRPRLHEVVEKYSQQVIPTSEHLGRRVKFQVQDTILGKDGNQSFLMYPNYSQTPKKQTATGSRGTRTLPRNTPGPSTAYQFGDDRLPELDLAGRQMPTDHGINLRRRSHVSLEAGQRFNLARSHKRQPIARDWSTTRKRFVASVACISTALIGIILGIYAGLVPSIQYYVIDPSHIVVLGNTGCFLGMAVPTFFFWPLPLLHGRKPYILAGLVAAMPLLFPQALAVTSQRLTDSIEWRSLLLASRTLMGVSLGFASMNFHSILTDLFGASLMSVNPHQEVVDHYDARRHGGGMGVWLGIWTWCWIGSLGLGFLIGAAIIDQCKPTWGFYVSIILIAAVLFLNVVCPEVRRSAYRRSVAEVRTGSDISRRVARGEIMMHRAKTGPRWWGEEVYHGILLGMEMLRQPGFFVMVVYSSWIYCQVVLIIVLLGSLASRYYKFRSPEVGLIVASMSFGAVLAIPFQKANIFSRSRFAQLNTNKATLDKRVVWSSHMVRRTVFSLLLPLAGICYAAVSSGPPTHISLPTIFSLCVGFLSCLAISECNGLIMETFDCSDLSPGMTGRQRGNSAKNSKRTNYSSFPRVTAGFALIHTFAFILAAGSTAVGGRVTRTLGQQVATGVVAGILFVLTVMLLLVLVRFVEIQIIPRSKFEEMDRVVEARRKSTIRRASMPNNAQAMMEEEQAWQPVMIGNPTGKTRRMNILELGGMTRWQEIRKKNRLIDSGAHLNRGALGHGLEALDDQMSDLRRGLHNIGSGKRRRKLYRSDESSGTGNDLDFEGYTMSNLNTPGANRLAEQGNPMDAVVIDEEGKRTRGK